MNDKIFLDEGHYRGNDGVEYMSVWTFKIKFNVSPNNNGSNANDALQMQHFNRFRGPFNQSRNFKEGWMYDVEQLKEFYSK